MHESVCGPCRNWRDVGFEVCPMATQGIIQEVRVERWPEATAVIPQ
jgi:hypothetical protein